MHEAFFSVEQYLGLNTKLINYPSQIIFNDQTEEGVKATVYNDIGLRSLSTLLKGQEVGSSYK